MVKLDPNQIKDCVLMCNTHILETPMSDREIYSTVLRPENLVVSANKSSASVCAEYAIRIAQENNIIYTNNTFFHIVDDTNIYRQTTDEDMDRFIYQNYTKELSSKNREEVIKALRHETYTEWSECNRDPYDIPFRNGIVNVKSNTFRRTLESDNITYCLPHIYDPEVLTTENALAFYRISLENNFQKRLFFSTMLGYCMTRSAEFQVFFVFKGRGGTGKSTLLDIVANVLGRENISNLQLDDFNREFGLEALFNKLANLGDDISGTKLVDSQAFKKASSGDVINVNRKYKSALAFAPFAKIIFTTNPYPKIADKTRAMERRMRIVSSDRVILPHELIPNFVKNLTERDYQAIINHAITAFHELLATGAKFFPDPLESKDMKEKLRLLGDHVYAFVKTNFPNQDFKTCLNQRGVMAQYQSFIQFSKERNYQLASIDTFREQVCDILEYGVEMDGNIEVFMSKEVPL